MRTLSLTLLSFLLTSCLSVPRERYPVLGMLVTSTGIIVYPFVRWNVRSVLWDGVDPDADDDPVQRLCPARLAKADSLQP